MAARLRDPPRTKTTLRPPHGRPKSFGPPRNGFALNRKILMRPRPRAPRLRPRLRCLLATASLCVFAAASGLDRSEARSFRMGQSLGAVDAELLFALARGACRSCVVWDVGPGPAGRC